MVSETEVGGPGNLQPKPEHRRGAVVAKQSKAIQLKHVRNLFRGRRRQHPFSLTGKTRFAVRLEGKRPQKGAFKTR